MPTTVPVSWPGFGPYQGSRFDPDDVGRSAVVYHHPMTITTERAMNTNTGKGSSIPQMGYAVVDSGSGDLDTVPAYKRCGDHISASLNSFAGFTRISWMRSRGRACSRSSRANSIPRTRSS